MIDEKELILSVKSGSECSYKALYELWVSRLYRFVYHYVKSETVTDDIVQETFLRIWNNRSKLDPECSFKSYLFTISYRLLLKEIHRQLNNPVMAEFIDYQSELATATDEAERKLEFDLFLVALEKAKKYLEEKGYADHVIELEESSATVQLAAEALGVEQGMIAKTMSFLVDGEPILILTEGTAKVDNRKYKDLFHVKAKMIPFDEVEEKIGHAPGGVCPFGINDGIAVYLDESLKQFTTVYPAAGNDHSAVKLTIPELEKVAGAKGWVDVCKEPEE